MNVKLELPEGMVLLNRSDLIKVVKDLLLEVQGDHKQERILKIKEVAEYLKVSIPTVRALISNKEIPYFQRGQVIRINLRDVQNWMQENLVKRGELNGDYGDDL